MKSQVLLKVFVLIVILTLSSVGVAEEKVVSEAGAAPTFYVGEYRVRGNSLLEPIDIELVLRWYLGEGKTVQDVEEARRMLETRYRDAGYPTALVVIPEQDVVDGVVYLNVIEGRIESLRISGSRYFSLQRIREQIPTLSEGAIPYMPAVQKQMSQLNRKTADRLVTPLLRPGETPGTLEVELKVKDTFPLHGELEINNRHTQNTTEYRANAKIQYDNLWQREHSISVQYQTAPEKKEEVQVVSGTYLARFSNTDNLLVVYIVHTESETAALSALTVIGEGDIAGLRGVFPLAGADDHFHSFSTGFDIKKFKEDVGLVGGDRAKTPIDYFNFTAQYNGTQRQTSSTQNYSVGLNLGIRELNDSDVTCVYDTNGNPIVINQFACKRNGAKPNYAYLRGSFETKHETFLDSQLAVSVSAQIADSPLISNEQFSVGGDMNVRGYYESQQLGDHGIQGSLEWYTPSIADHLFSDHLDDLRFLLFVDGGYVKIKDPLAGQNEDSELYSAGVGLRLQAWKTLSVSADYASSLKTSGSVKEGDERVHFTLSVSF